MSRKHKPPTKPPIRVIVREDQSGWAPPSPGHPSYRAWLYSGDEYGRTFSGTDGQGAMVVRETRSYAPGRVSDDDIRNEQRTALESRLATLTDDEHEVLRLQEKLREYQEVRVSIAAGELVRYQRMGYTFVSSSARIETRGDLPPIEVIDVSIWQVVQVEALSREDVGMRLDERGVAVPERRTLSYADIAERMGVTAERVHSLVKSAMRKMRARQ